MSGDLSLSGSLGGLRIANPDEDEAVASPTSPVEPTERSLSSARPPPPSSRSSTSTVTPTYPGSSPPTISSQLPPLPHQSHEQDAGHLGFNPNDYGLRSTSPAGPTLQHGREQSRTPQPTDEAARQRLSHRQSIPLGHQMQQSAQCPSSYSTGYPQQIRQHSVQSTSTRPISGMYQLSNTSSSSAISSSQGSYRYRDDMGSSDGSVSGLGRSGSRSTRAVMSGVPQRDNSRSYRQGSQHSNGGNGPLPPRRNSRRVRDSQLYDASDIPYAVQSGSSDTYRERARSGPGKQEADGQNPTNTRPTKKGVKDFNFGRTLGEGSYSTVLAATDRQNLKEYAIKVLDKRHIIKEKKVKYVNIERDTLNRLTEHPGIVRLYYTFQDQQSLYFVLDLASGGELLGVLKRMGSFDLECTRFYGAEILDSVAYMHSRGIIHRDLKPENVLLDREMHVKITDFGTAKILPDPRPDGSNEYGAAGNPTDGAETDRAMSFVGTAEYVSPELLRDKNACKASDLWAFGCIIYQLLAGRPPFKAANEYLTFQKILGLEYTFPDGFPEVARDLVERLLVLEPSKRLPIEHIRNHRFFEGIEWGKGLWRQRAPRLNAFVPSSSEPIRLNGGNKSGGNMATAGASAALSSPALQSQAQMSNGRPQLRGVTDLPPPSQLDIDWQPVLKYDNERILKLGNLVVVSGGPSTSPNGKNGEPGTPSEKPRFRLFGGNTTKKRERLVLITSRARLIIAAAGGNEKKAKMEVDFWSSGATWKSYVDSKGLTAWQLDTRDKHITFEDPRATTADPAGSKYSTQEWLDSLEQARELAVAQSMTNSYSGDSMLHMDSGLSSPADSLGTDAAMPLPSPNDRHMMRQTLRKTNTDDSESFKGRKRFSKRHSKSGLAAVF